MRILQLISSSGFFGAEKVMLQLSGLLSDSGYEVYSGVLSNKAGSHMDFVRAAEKKGMRVKVFDCRGKFDVRAIKKLRTFIKKEQIDLVHSHGYKSNFYVLAAACGLNIKKVTTCHNWISCSSKMKVYEYIDKFLLRNFDQVAAVSENVRNEIYAAGVSVDKVDLIKNGIDIDTYAFCSQKPDLKKSFGISAGDLVVGSVGRLSEEKGHEYLIKAFSQVVIDHPDYKLLIVGDGVLRESLELLVRSLEIQDKVIFTGIRDDIPELLNIMDIFVLPSLTEGMPLALLEAMAAGKVVIASKVGEIPDIIDDQFNGGLVSPKDIDALSRAIAKLIKSGETRKTFGDRACEKVNSNFSAQNMAQQYMCLYGSVLNGVK